MKGRLINFAVGFFCGLLICLFCFFKLVTLHHEQEDARSFDTFTAETESETECDIRMPPNVKCYDIDLELMDETDSETDATPETHFDETQMEYDIDGEVYTVTAYCGCVKCCGKTDGITATGTQATEGRTIAVDPSVIPYGTIVYINGTAYVAEDCGGAIKGNHIDMYFNSHEAALEWGVRQCVVSY